MTFSNPNRQIHRRDFLRNLVITTGGVTLGASFLASCGGDSSTSSSGGLIIGTPDKPVKLPITTDAIADGLAEETGTLEILSWADYQNPESIAAFESKFGVKVSISIYDSEEAAIVKLRNGTFNPDLILGMTDTALARLVAADLLQPLNKSYIPNFGNVITGLQNPYYDQESRYTVPYVVYGNGIGYRRDRIDPEIFTSGNGYDVMWDAKYSGKAAVLDSYRDSISMAMFRAGKNDVNTGDADVLAQAGADLIALRETLNPKVDILSYQEIPAGNRDIAGPMWSGDILSALMYLPEDTPADVLGFWYPENTITANDFFCITKKSKAPVLAHRFIDYMSDTDNALVNFSYVGYQPALESITAETLLSTGAVIESLVDALITPERYASGQRLIALDPAVDQLWLDQWTAFTAG